MQIDILTLFPNMFAPLKESIMKRAQDKGLLCLNISNIRDYTCDKHHITDDKLYGGGAGMVMKPEPIFAAVEGIQPGPGARIVVTSPQGRPFDQALAQELAGCPQLIIICGHYEGIDERVIENLATDLISLGDFVLTGGELAAMAITDAVTRLLPGVLGDAESSREESFSEGLLEYPHYTRPPLFREWAVPEVLLGGHHAEICRWRRQEALRRTWQRRPELLTQAPLTPEDKDFLRGLQLPKYTISLALLHYPVSDKKGQVISTSLTNLDLHDISRAALTFGLEKFYLVQPQESQRELLAQLLTYWQSNSARKYNPYRAEALALIKPCISLEEAFLAASAQTPGQTLKVVATSARAGAEMTGYAKLRRIMEREGGHYLLLLGTGWGLTEETLAGADYRLRPVYGVSGYNHLSVRSAASIILDRLLGELRQ